MTADLPLADAAEVPDADRADHVDEAKDVDEERPNQRAEARWYLNDERQFLLQSLDDADREHSAGDLSDEDHEVLALRDHRRLAEVEAELASLGPERDAPAAPATGSSAEAVRFGEWRRVGIIAACFLIVAGAVILVDHAVNPRLPGQASSGSITVSKEQQIEQQLSQAATLNNGGQPLEAYKLYQTILTEDPNDPQALAALGWLDWNYGTQGNAPTLEAEGRRSEQKAIRVAPTYWAGHLFLGLILYNQDHNATGAVAQFNQFLADHPAAAQVTSVAPLLKDAYVQAGVAVPAALGPTTTTTTTPAGPTTPAG
jgi:tetratricopeptide (TPR) repeat protein